MYIERTKLYIIFGTIRGFFPSPLNVLVDFVIESVLRGFFPSLLCALFDFVIESVVRKSCIGRTKRYIFTIWGFFPSLWYLFAYVIESVLQKVYIWQTKPYIIFGTIWAFSPRYYTLSLTTSLKVWCERSTLDLPSYILYSIPYEVFSLSYSAHSLTSSLKVLCGNRASGVPSDIFLPCEVSSPPYAISLTMSLKMWCERYILGVPSDILYSVPYEVSVPLL